MQESLLDDEDLLNEADGLGGEDAPAPSSSSAGGGDEREDEHVPWEVRQEQRELKKRAKERAREQRDAKVVQMILREQQELGNGGSGVPAAATKEELKKLDSKKLRERRPQRWNCQGRRLTAWDHAHVARQDSPRSRACGRIRKGLTSSSAALCPS